MKKTYITLLTLILCIALLAGCSSGNKTTALTIDEKSFDTPEKVIEYFVSGIAENDLSKAFEACNINEYGEEFDYTAYAERAGAILPAPVIGAPSEYPMYVELNRYMQANNLCTQIKGFTYSFFSDIDMSGTTVLENTDQAAEFVEGVDPSKLKSLAIVRMDIPYPNTMNSEETKELFKTQSALYGADNQTERIVLYELDGKQYCGGFTLLQYGSDWKISQINSTVANQAAFGNVTETTEEDYVYLTE